MPASLSHGLHYILFEMVFLRLLFVFLFLPSFAEAVEIVALGGFNYAAPTEHLSGIDQQFTGDSASAFGLSFGFQLFSSPLDFETGLFFLSEASENNLNGVITLRTSSSKEVPFLIRFHFDQAISIGVGGYASFYDNNVDLTSAGVTTPQTMGETGLKKADSGALFSLRAQLHLVSQFFLTLDARYQHGLANLATQSGDVHNTRSVEMLGGLSLDL